MALDKIYTLRTGVSLKISTLILQEMIATIPDKRKFSEYKHIRSVTDLYDYLSVIVYKGAADLIKRREQWIGQKNRADLVAARPIPFQEFCRFFWRNLDEYDPDGDEWIRLIADDSFYFQLSGFLNQVRAAERKVQLDNRLVSDLNFGPV